MTKLKVLSITHGGILNATGRQRYMPLFQDNDIELTLLVPSRWKEFNKDIVPDPVITGTRVYVEKIRFPLLPKVEWYLHYYPNLGKVIKHLKPDVIHLWEEPWSLVSLQALYLRDRYVPHAALLLETDQNILRKLPPPFEQLRSYMLKKTDLLIGRGDEALDVSKACGYNGPTAIVEYGIERANFTTRGKDEARRKYGVNKFTIGYVGRIVSYKGLSDIVDAMAISKNDIQFNILGAGDYQDEFEAYVASKGLADKVKIYPPKPASEVATFIKSLDVLLLMSRTTKTWKEQFGRVIMEAQACGVPVIGSNSGSIPSVVGPGGWTIAEGDANALARWMDFLITHPAEIQRVADEGVKQVDNRFNFDVIAKALKGAYISAANARKFNNNSASTDTMESLIGH